MDLNLYECPECGWKGNFTPNECPVCGCDLVEHRANVKAEMRKEAQAAAEREKLEEIEKEYKKAIELFNNSHFKDARTIFMSLGDYKDSVIFAEKCKDGSYQIAVKEFNETAFLKNLVSQEESIESFQDPFVQKCRAEHSAYRFELIRSIFEERFNGYKQSNEYIAYCNKAIALFQLYDQQEADYRKYTKAVSLYNSGQYEKAIAAFKKIEDVLDSKEYISKCRDAMHQHALKTLESGDYTAAKAEAEKIPQGDNAPYVDEIEKKHNEASYQHALQTLEAGDYETALKEFLKLPQSEDESVSDDFAQKYHEAIYKRAVKYFDKCEYKEALDEMYKIPNAKDNAAYTAFIEKCCSELYEHALRMIEYHSYELTLEDAKVLAKYKGKSVHDDILGKYYDSIFYHAQELYLSRDYVTALEEVEKIPLDEEHPLFVDLKEKCIEKLYRYSLAQFESKNYEEALQGFQKISEYKDASDYIERAKKEIEDIKLTEYVEGLNREAEREEKELKKNKRLRLLHIPVYCLNLLSCLAVGVVLFLHKEPISLYSSFWWWFGGWAVIALISFSTFGSYMREAFRKPGTPKFKIHKNAPKTALIMIALYLVAALVLIWRFGNWF